MSLRGTISRVLITAGEWLQAPEADAPEPADEQWKQIQGPLEGAVERLGTARTVARKVAGRFPKGTVSEDLYLLADEALDLVMQIEALQLRAKYEPASPPRAGVEQ